MSAEWINWADHVLAALLNGMAQGLLLTAAVWLVLKLIPRTNAATRHAVWLAALAVVLALPLLHFIRQPREIRFAASPVPPASTPVPAMPTQAHPILAEHQALIPLPKDASEGDAASSQPDLLAQEGALEMDLPGRFESDTASDTTVALDSVPPWVVLEGTPVANLRDSAASSLEAKGQSKSVLTSLPMASGSGLRAAIVSLRSRWETWTRPAVRSFSVWLPRMAATLVLLVLGALGMIRLGALARQLILLRRVKRQAKTAPPAVQKHFDTLLAGCGASRAAELRVCAEAHSPMVVGFKPPAVLITAYLVAGLDLGRIDPILRHELAHVERCDDWANLAQQAARALLSFHPAVVWICRNLAMEREIACDDYVLHSGQKARDYALLLTEFAGRNQCRDWTAAPAAWSRKSQLTERVNMILKTNRNISPRLAHARLGLLTTVAAGGAVLLMQMAPQLSLAHESAAGSALPAASTSSSGTALTEESASAILNGIPSAEPSAQPRPAAVTALAPTPLIALAPPTPLPRVPESGPRAKDVPSAENAPVPPAAPEAVEPAAAPEPPSLPQGGGAPGPDGQLTGSSFEQRLARVERILESLVNQRSKGRVIVTKPVPKVTMNKDSKECLDLNTDLNTSINLGEISEDVLKSIKEATRQAQQQAMEGSKMAKVEMKRAMEQAERAMRDAAKRSKEQLDAAKGPLDQQLRALEAQRGAIEKQLQDVEKRLEKLQEQREKIDAEREKHQQSQNDSENSDKDDEVDEDVDLVG